MQVCPQILLMFDANAETEQRWRQVLLTRHFGSPLNRRLDRPKARRVADEADVSAHGVRRRRAAMDIE